MYFGEKMIDDSNTKLILDNSIYFPNNMFFYKSDFLHF